jgi:hypothetical protein
MLRNVGQVDRVVRAVLAVVALVLALVAGLDTAGGVILLIVTVLLGGTATMSWCPLYKLTGMSTCQRGPKTAS